ncbi:PcfJ domain-containing protein [Paenibacillus agricola]|uniref:PcfJ-like protein n=1 Tax=Paenibacillus agricola TaxID=2716264 RepID=A0ABX0JI26_9BACL|nr:PcfJ domain-containing protein [Paenibacillus agricola]NHN33521.1 hypothetical protein [Paenibacillus agricola]
MSSPEFQEFVAHIPLSISQEIEDYATNTVFLSSRYVFVRSFKGFQFGYCSHCKNEYMTLVKLKHNQDWQCPRCLSLVKVKSSGMGRKKMLDDAYFIYYQKSAINSNAVVARGIYAYRSYQGDYYKTETVYKDIALYLFEPGSTKMLQRDYWFGCDSWHMKKNVRSEMVHSMKNKRSHTAVESIVPAVHGTHLQYCTWEKYEDQYDLVKFFDLAARYPCVEYLTKMGLRNVVESKLNGLPTYRVINWRGKSIDKVLRISKAELRDLRSAPFTVMPLSLHSYHFYKKRGLKLTFVEAHLLRDLTDGYYWDMSKELFKHAPFTRISQYTLRQLNRDGVQKHYRNASSVLTALRDYIKDCMELGMDLEQEHVLFPNNLYEAHQKTIRKMKVKKDETLNVKITARLNELNRFSFEYAGFIIRPAASILELFDEGKALEHCVGGYTDRYADGKTNLFVLRRSTEPETPFYTVEVVGQEIKQVRGKKNCNPTDEVQAFIEAFKAQKLVKKSRKSNLKVAVPA